MAKTGGSQDSSFGSYIENLRQVGKEGFERPIESNDGLKLAQVLYVFAENEAINVLQDYSVRIPKAKDEKSKLVKIIARIPVIHANLDEPTDKDLEASREKASGFDYKKTAIANYPVFVALNEDVGVPSVGNYVWVQYNKSAVSKFGVYVSIAEGEYAGVQTDAGESSGGGDSGESEFATIVRNPSKKVWLDKNMVKTGELLKKGVKEPWVHTVVNGINVYDCRGFFGPPRLGLFVRPLSSINGIVLHRTSCVIGDRVLQHAKTNAHCAVTMGGNIYLIHDWTLGIFHGHSLSERTIGIEFDGNPEGFPGGGYWIDPDYKKNGKPLDKYKGQIGPHPITEQQVKASWVLLDIILKEVKAGGGNIVNILAHRQSTSERASDPGWDCWKKIAIPWQEKIRAADTIGVKIKTGQPIPKEWNPDSPYKWNDK